METIFRTRELLFKGAFMATINLKDAYLNISTRDCSKPFLMSAVKGQGRTVFFVFNALSFGLASAPRIFTKVLAEALQVLRTTGIQIIAYLDDLLLCVGSPAELEKNLNFTMNHLQPLGWMVNTEKSNL